MSTLLKLSIMTMLFTSVLACEKKSSKYTRALDRAEAWLSAISVDPQALRARKMLGIKKHTELISGYFRLWQVAEGKKKQQLHQRLQTLGQTVLRAEYHDLAKASDTLFRQEVMSYLSAAYLLERAGIHIGRYREEIRKIKPRLDAQMKQRAPYPQAVFHWYYGHFSLKEPFPLGHTVSMFLTRQRPRPETLSERDAYMITHEVYAATHFGDRRENLPFSSQDRSYLRETLDYLVSKNLQNPFADLLAEEVACQALLGFCDSPVYWKGLRSLLELQKPNGAWGEFEEEGQRHGPEVQRLFRIHSTVVAIEALVFHLTGRAPCFTKSM